MQSVEFVASAFSADGKLLAALGGAPDHALVVWLWDKGKVLGVSKLMQPVSRVSFNPSDSSTLGSSGSKDAGPRPAAPPRPLSAARTPHAV